MRDVNRLNDLFDEASKKLTKELGKEVTKDDVARLFAYQWKFVRNCMRGGANIRLDKFGSFTLINKKFSRKYKYVEEKGGYENVLKLHEPVSDIPSAEVVYNPELFPDKAVVFEEDVIEKKKDMIAAKMNSFFGERLTGSRRNK